MLLVVVLSRAVGNSYMLLYNFLYFSNFYHETTLGLYGWIVRLSPGISLFLNNLYNEDGGKNPQGSWKNGMTSYPYSDCLSLLHSEHQFPHHCAFCLLPCHPWDPHRGSFLAEKTCPQQQFSNFRAHQNHLESLLKTNCWVSSPKFLVQEPEVESENWLF